MVQGSGKFRIQIERQVGMVEGRQFVRRETVKPGQPVGLVEPMFADEGGRVQETRVGIEVRAKR